ncbi:MAG: phage tail tape measure protein [Oscillospiraceae bacterium]|nr:phage tail tape measure protein [Oscillospiraceae bacterium]
MDVFDLQASLRLNKSDYEKALKEAEKEAEKFAREIESSVGSTINNITKNYNKVINDSSTNISNVYKTITKEAESSAAAQIKANAQVYGDYVNAWAKAETARLSAAQKSLAEKERLAEKEKEAELAANAKIEAARIAADQRANSEREKLALQRERLAEKEKEAEISAAAKIEAARIAADQRATAESQKLAQQREQYEEQLASKAAKEAEKKAEAEAKAAEKAAKEAEKLAQQQIKEAEKAAAEQKKIAENAWKNIYTTASTYVQDLGKTLSTLGSIAKSAFNAVYEAGKFAFHGVADLAGEAFSSFHDIAAGAISGVTDIIGTATNALIDFGKQAVSVGMDFDKSMSQVAATLETTIDEINNGNVSANFSFDDFSGSLREMAVTLGENTKFTSSEAAQAINNMALAGYKQQEIADSIEEVLNMASAGNIGIAEAATYITKGGNALGLTPEEIRLLTDQIAVGASNSGSTVATLGKGIMKIGAQARTLAGGTAELVQILGLLSNAGENLTGTQGGNALKNIIKNLQNPRSDAAAARFEQMGIQTYDSQTGEFRAIQDIVADFRDYFTRTLGEDYENKQEYSEIMNDIFTSYSITGMTALIGTDPEEWVDLWNRLSEAEGAAAEMAAKQLDNLAGDVTLFNSALDSVKVRISDNLTPALREFTQFGTEQMGKLANAVKEKGIAGGFEMLSAVVGNTVEEINSMLPSIVKSATDTFKAFVKGIRNHAKEIGSGFSQVLVTLADAPVEILPDMIDGGMQIAASLANGLTKAVPKITEQIPKLVKRVTKAIKNNAEALKEAGKSLLESVFTSIEDNKSEFDNAFNQLYDGVIVPAFDDLFINLPAYLSEKIGGIDTSEISGAVSKMIGKLDISGAVDSAGSLFQSVFTKAGEFLDSEDMDIAGIISSAVNLGSDIFNGAIDILFGENGLDFEKIGEGINSVVQNIDFEKIGENINTLANGFLDSTNTLLTTIDWKSVGNGAGSVINGIDYSGILHKVFDIIKNVITNTPDLLSGVASAIDSSTANQLISMGTTLALGQGITTAISLWFKSEAAATMLGTVALSLGGFLKDVFTAQITIKAIAGGCSLAFGATAVVSAVGAAIAGWGIGTLIRDAIGAEKVDNFLSPVTDSFKDAWYQIKAGWEWTFNNLSGLSYDQIYKNIALDETASGFGFQSDKYRQKVLSWQNDDIYDSFGNGNGINFFDFENEVNSKMETVRWLLEQNSSSDDVKQSGKNLAGTFGSGIASSTAIEDEWQIKLDKINTALTADNSIIAASEQSGKDMMKLFADGISENAYLPEKEIKKIADFGEKNLGFSVPEEGAFSKADTWMPDMMELFADGIKNNSGLVENNITSLTNSIQSRFDSLKEKASVWGFDLIQNFTNGIINAYNSVIDTVSGIAETIRAYIGFSEPEKGALSDFHTYAPDMMKLFADGIKENQYIVLSQAETFAGNLADVMQNHVMVNAELTGIESPDVQTQGGEITFSDNLDTIANKIKGLTRQPLYIPVQPDIPVSPEIPRTHYETGRNTSVSGSQSRTVIQNLNLSIPGFNINSPDDISELVDRAIREIDDHLTVLHIQDNRGYGGAGWT